MATIVDVAKAAQVSVATVSRVLNGSYTVTEEKKQKVMEAIKEVGYLIPARMKISQQASDQKKIILIVGSIFPDQICGPFQHRMDELGYQVIFYYYTVLEQFSMLEQLINTIRSSLAGIMLINTIDSSPEFQALVGSFPLVQIGEPIIEKGSNCVVYTDEISMSQDATNYLLSKGKKKIGILTSEPGPVVLFSRKKRLQGYYLALMDHGMPVDQTLVEYSDISIDGGFYAAQKLLQRHPDVDAIIGTCDVICQGAVYAVLQSGKPIELFSMDTNEAWGYARSTISYMDLNHTEMGDTAASILYNLICGDGNPDCRIIIPHTLHPAESTFLQKAEPAQS